MQYKKINAKIKSNYKGKFGSYTLYFFTYFVGNKNFVKKFYIHENALIFPSRNFHENEDICYFAS